MLSTRAVSLQKVKNVRDLGGIPVAGGRVVKSGLLYRGGSLAAGTEDDFRQLFDVRGIRHVVDLRIGYECQAKPEPAIAGVEWLHIPFYDRDIVGYEYFQPVPGTITIGNDFACNPHDFYQDMANERTARQIAQALQVVTAAAAAGEPVYFHCSNGKDRAGILSLLVLELLGAAPEDITADYELTNESRDADIPRIYQRFLRLCQGDEEFAARITAEHRARPENLVAFREAVDARYGSMEVYLQDVLGFSAADQAALREALTVPA